MKKLLLTLVGMIWSAQVVLATTCAGATAIPASPTFPYVQSLVCGAGNDITSANSSTCGNGSYKGGQESVYSWTPTVNYVNATIAYTGVSWSGIFVYAGCPTAGGTCVGNVTSSATTKTLNVASFTAGVTYYFVFDTWPTPNSPCPGSFTLNATIAPPANPATPSQLGGIPTCTTGAQLGFTNTVLSCSASATASGNDDAATTATVNNFSCATGTITSASLNASIGANCPSWYYYSIVVNGVTVATNQCNQTNFDLTPYLPLTSVSIVSANNPADSPDFVTLNMTVNLNYQVPFSLPADVVYYWQTSATGTSQAVPHVDPYYVFANGTYYVRAYNTVTGVWSTGSSSVVVSNFPVASPPPAATAGTNPSCVPLGSSLTAATAPAGYEYYWQGTVSGGSSTAMPATAPYAYTSSGTYYLAAYETVSGCWSNTVGTSVTVNSMIPPAPTVSQAVYNVCSGVSSVPVSASVPTATAGTCTVTATATGTDNTGVTATVNNFPCITGVVTSASMTASIGGFCPSWYYYSIVVNGVTVATQQCGPNFDLTPYLPITSVSIISADNPSDGVGDFVTMNLSVSLNMIAPTYTLAWYDAASNGNVLATTSPLETVGTSVMPATTNGTYNFYVGTMQDGCASATNELVSVLVSDVNAPLIPVNVTCNGGDNGSFTLGTIQCGTAPFAYSFDNGVTFGAIPTDLIAGNYTVIIQDANGLLSSSIPLEITQPAAPANVAMGQINYFSADISWTTTGNELQWNVEFGPVGFTPGTGAGTIQVANTNFYTITGLTENTDYDVYVSAICGPNPEFSAVTSFSTNPGFFTWDNQCGPGYTDISSTGTALNLCDDCTTTITTTNPVSVNSSAPTNTITVSNNGWISFGGVTLNVWSEDWDTESGNVYWEETVIGGDNYLIVEWHDRPRFSGVVGQSVTFEVMVNQATGEVYYLYDDVVVGGSQAYADFGGNGLINAVTSSGTTTISSYNTTFLTNNSCVHFYNALCPNPTNMVTTIFQEEIDLDWTAGPYGETEWTVIYGPVGFDPATSGTILTTTTSDIQINGLTQLTEYDIYIYSECTVDALTSDGFLVNATTLPWCADPITVSGTNAVDSIFMNWDWIPVATATNGGISSFNMTYGQTNFDVYSNGTELVANGIDFADSIVDATFLPGQVIDVYLQAVCGVDTSNYVGPFTITMPISNDTVCGAEELMVDGTVYIFDNTGATVTVGETGIVPSQTGYNATDLPQVGWGQPTLQRTTWFTFTAPASGSMRFSGEDVDAFWSQIAIYDAPVCNDFNTFELLAASDQASVTTTTIGNTTTIDTIKVAPNFTICGLTPGATYYIMHDSWAGATGASTLQGQYSITMTPINLEAGTFVDVLDACTGTSVVLFDGITGYQTAGSWTAELAPAGTGLTDSLFNTSGLGYQVFNFEYRVADGCAYDSIVAQVQIFPLSSAGTDGTITVCKNEPVDLLSGLGGNVDLGGSWYNPSNQLMPSSSIYASNIPGQFNYDYITGNGVCPDDTANVLLTVDGTCDWLNVEELYFSSMTLLPNPTNGLVYITNEGNSEVFNYEVIDVDGRVIASKANAINGASTTTIDLTGKVTGMYMIRVYNGNAEKVFRVVLQ